MNKRLAFVFIIITLTIDAMGIGLIIPVMPELLREIGGGDLGNAAIWVEFYPQYLQQCNSL
jgi:DHA1 family tetracycline resistance protein-like MFS transporter